MTSKADKREATTIENTFATATPSYGLFFSRLVNKISGRGILVNKLDQGQLKYFNYNKNFVEDTQVVGKYKQGINVIDIESETITTKKKNRILIEFEKKSLFDETNKSKFNAKDKEQIGKWEFICEKQEQAEFIVQKIKEAKMNIREEQNAQKLNQYATKQQQKESPSALNNYNTNQKESIANFLRSNTQQLLNEEDEEDDDNNESREQSQNDLKLKIKNYVNDEKNYSPKRGNESPSKSSSVMKLNSQSSQKGSLNQLPQVDQQPAQKKENQIANQINKLTSFKGQRQSILQINNNNEKDSLAHIPQIDSYQKPSNDVFKINIEKVQNTSSSSDNDSEEEKDIASPMLDMKRKFQRTGGSLPPVFNGLIPPQQQLQLQQLQSQPILQESNSQRELSNVSSTPALRSAASTQVSSNLYDGSMTTAHRSHTKQNTMIPMKSDSSIGSFFGGTPFQRTRNMKQNTTIGIFPMSESQLRDNSEKSLVRRNAENSHEFRYHNFLETSLRGAQLEEQIKEGIKLFLYLGQFKEKAIRAAKSLIEDLMLPKPKYEPRFKCMTAIPDLEKARDAQSSQNIKSQSPSKKNQGLIKEQFQWDPNKEPEEDDMYYIPEENMIAKVFYTKIVNINPTDLADQIQFNKEDGVDYHDSSSSKYGGDQFRILKHISNSYIKIRKYDSSYSLRVPLSILVEYLGFKVLIYARPQYEKNIVYGPIINEKDGIFQEYKKIQKYEQKIQEDAEKLRKRLRIKQHYFGWKHDEPIECILTFETEIHKSAGDRSTKINLIKYKKDTILIDQDKEEDQFYIEKYDDFFPINTFLDCQFSQNQMRFPRRLRPEILLKKKKFLNPEACFSQIKYLPQENKENNILQKQQINNLIKLEKQDLNDIEEVEQYTKYLSTTQLFKLIEQFDNLDIIPYDSHTIEEALHSYGLNIKYISYIAMHSTTPYVKLLFEQEMVARTVKKMIRTYLAQFTFQSRKTGQATVRRGNVLDTQTGMFQQQKAQDIQKNTIMNQKKAVLDTLNLVFENSKESKQFWQQINTQILLEYGYPNQVCLGQFEKGGLLNSIHYNCTFLLTYGLDVFDKKQNGYQKKEQNHFAQQILQQLELVDEDMINERKNTMPWNNKGVANIQPSTIVDPSIALNESYEDYPQEILTIEDFLDFTCESKMFDYKDIPIQVYSNLQIPSDPQKQVQAITIKDKISQALISDNKERFFTLFNMAKSYFMIGYYKECIETANNCISCLDYFPSVLLVDPLCLLIKCYIILKEKQKVQYLFWKTEEIIDFNLGKMHPLHCSLLNIMSVYYESVGQFEEQIILMRASSNLIQRIVGSNHRRTAQAIFELANILSEHGMTAQAIGNYESSFYIYAALKGDQNKKSADIGYKLALETFALRELDKSKKFCSYCLQFFEGKEKIYIYKIVDLKILVMKIMKIQQENNQEYVKQLSEIWEYMYKREYTELVHISELLKEYIQYYLQTLTEKVKVFLSQQFESILNGLIKINILDSFQIEDIQQKSKYIILKEIIENNNKNDPLIFIERTFLTLAEEQQKNNTQDHQNQNEDEEEDKRIKKNVFKFVKSQFNYQNQSKDQQPPYGQKNKPSDQYNSNIDAKDDDQDFTIRRYKSLFEHLICLIGVSFFKSTFLQNII